ncbi:MAG: hypothetical protein LBE91_15525 [Tannerella sp.]|nr:hypothetical protein [Tannerella sp.]
MKRVILTIIFSLFCGIVFISCDSPTEPQNDEVITLSDGRTLNLKNYEWLKELINKSKTDKTSQLFGCIWLENYSGKEIFVTNMGLGSGGILNWFFDSSGNHFVYKEQGNRECPACKFVGNHHVFLEDVFHENDGTSDRKFDVLVYSSMQVPCE